MDVQQQNRPYLEPIQEESEQEDETEGSRTEDREEDFQSEVGVEMGEEVAQEEEEEEEEEEDDDDDVPLRVMRPRRLSRSLSKESFLQSRSADNHQGDLENSSVSDAVDLSDEAKSSWQTNLGNEEQAIGRGLREKKLQAPEPSVQKKTKKKKHKEKSQCLFPPWVVELMVNIEEATTHRLVVE
ncbi:glutamic acid-rich protein isoform X2 [Hippoglossus stenolepis]|uniref:glutamic acid-rich protein isoform X2 n=1 Tax=Hippoglossus stenolepis TaxID=195615 RepID=UPI001FAE7854|nr:glutamic acid-rich protein isoform X2 [Hippoglossus stenolepis]